MYKIQDMDVKKGIKRVYFLSLCGNISSGVTGTLMMEKRTSLREEEIIRSVRITRYLL